MCDVIILLLLSSNKSLLASFTNKLNVFLRRTLTPNFQTPTASFQREFMWLLLTQYKIISCTTRVCTRLGVFLKLNQNNLKGACLCVRVCERARVCACVIDVSQAAKVSYFNGGKFGVLFYKTATKDVFIDSYVSVLVRNIFVTLNTSLCFRKI